MADRSEFDVPGNSLHDRDWGQGGGINRRTLMKAGAATAWTVPLIQVIAATPASADPISSGGSTAIEIVSASATWGNLSNKKDLNVSAAVKNDGGTNPTNSLQLTFTFDTSKVLPTSATVTNSGGWQGPSTSGNAYVFTYGQLNGGSTSGTLQVDFGFSSDKTKKVGLTITATASNAPPPPEKPFPNL